MVSAFQLTIDPEGIARIVFDTPDEKVNVLSQPLLDELQGILEGLQENSQVKALVMTSGKKNVFIAGADVKEFKYGFNDPEKAEQMLANGHRTVQKLTSMPFPTIAVIDGVCLGGGMELVLGFDYRIVTDNPKTQLGLPEVNLGIFPGWGGTQRLPRLIGFIEAVKMIVTGKPVNARKAWKIHLTDAIVSAEFAKEKTEEFLQQILTPEGARKVKQRRKLGGLMHYLFEANPLGRSVVAWQTRRKVLEKTEGHYPSPIKALEVIQSSYGLPLEKGLQYEKEQFIRSIPGPFKNAKQLIRLFFLQERLKKDAGRKVDAEPKEVKAAAVIGAGVMGSGIAFIFSKRDISVRMKDINWEAIGSGYGAAWSVYHTLIKIRKMTKEEASIKFQRISATVDYSGFHNRDLVIEAATEDLGLKKKILAELEEKVPEDTIIGTNTSSLPLSEMAGSMKHPERFVGMHFFNPVPRMPLVEVIAGEKTSEQALATAIEICRKLGKTPIIVGDCPGFLVNRIFAAGMLEGMALLEEGAEIEALDKAIKQFGMPMGPCRLADEVGNDVNCKVMHHFAKAYGDRMKAPELLDKVVEKGFLGKKAGKGFYLYNGKKKRVNPEVNALLKKNPSFSLTDQDMVDRIVLAMVNEAARCLEEKIAPDAGIVDMAMVMGTGFPPFRGGLLSYADEVGLDTVVRKLQKFEQMHGVRYAPAKLLVTMAEEGKTFY